MLTVQPFSQRDPKWANLKHGTSGMTIGQTGCTISILATMLVHAGYNTDPSKLNKLLTDNQGYANGNLVIWQAIQQLFPKVTFVYRHYNYQNDLAKAWINKGLMPIIEVGAAPIGGAPGGKHWVGFVGDKKSVDPWTGTIKDTSTWQPTGMALFDYVPSSNQGGNMDMYKGYDLDNKDSMRAAVDVVVRLQNGEFVDKPVHEKLLKEANEACDSRVSLAKNNERLITVQTIASNLGLPNTITDTDGLKTAVEGLIHQSNNQQPPAGNDLAVLPTADKLKVNGFEAEFTKDNVKYKINYAVKE